MPKVRGGYYKIKTYTSGKKVRLQFNSRGDVVEASPVKVKQTRTRKRLNKARRRIGLR